MCAPPWPGRPSGRPVGSAGAGANPTIPKGMHGYPLQAAVQCGNEEIVQMVLDAGANVNLKILFLDRRTGLCLLSTVVLRAADRFAYLYLACGSTASCPAEPFNYHCVAVPVRTGE
jgi:hypothetical protein